MSLVHENIELLESEQDNCLICAAECLVAGSLSLFIGAGIGKSSDLPFPSWQELVERIADSVNITLPWQSDETPTNNKLLDSAEDVEERCDDTGQDFKQLVKNSLYQNITSYDNALLQKELLISLGSLVMNSSRGKASCVVNYNFDDLLEWYLEYHGFTVDVLSNYPELSNQADVQIYHPHGFLPLQDKYSDSIDDLVFTKRSYQIANSVPTSPWNKIQSCVTYQNLCLFVGMSGDDEHVDTIVGNTYDEINSRRIVGIILLLDTPSNHDASSRLKRRGIVPYYFREFSDLPSVLLQICRLATNIR